MADRPPVCPRCGASEVESRTPDTTYGCGSRDHQQQPGTFREGLDCVARQAAYWRGYEQGLADQSGSEVLQAVLDAIAGRLDLSTNIADHPNVKFATMQRHLLLEAPR
jgi:hypothetical protein